MIEFRRWGGGVVLTTALVSMAAVVVGCSGMPALLGDSGSGLVESPDLRESTTSTRSTSEAGETAVGDVPTTSARTVPGQDGLDRGGSTEHFNADVGECLRFEGPWHEPDGEKTVCGSPESIYRVIAKAPHTDMSGGE